MPTVTALAAVVVVIGVVRGAVRVARPDVEITSKEDVAFQGKTLELEGAGTVQSEHFEGVDMYLSHASQLLCRAGSR